ncbi:hypothetical protein [Nostoc sp.]
MNKPHENISRLLARFFNYLLAIAGRRYQRSVVEWRSLVHSSTLKRQLI